MKKLLLGTLLIVFGLPILAEEQAQQELAQPELEETYTRWITGINLARLTENGADLERSMFAAIGSLGYRFRVHESIYVIPELRIGIGAGNDRSTVKGTDIRVALDNYIALSARGQVHLDNGLYFFIAPAYANFGYRITNSQNGDPKPDVEDPWEFGFGGGLGYLFVQNMSADLWIEQYDDKDMASLALRLYF